MILFIADRIKSLREKSGMTQSQLAKRLCVSRNAVNSWEMSLSTPSSIYLVELSKIFGVSTDFLLSLDEGVKLDITDLSEQEQEMVIRLVDYFKSMKE
ncbi:MAG: helix-turn-helix transcriptional regulator [Oscillospiraceae bacterium]|nr:helix-turn-helix transcriptional regulator [Oscillospiraceae bacterium]